MEERGRRRRCGRRRRESGWREGEREGGDDKSGFVQEWKSLYFDVTRVVQTPELDGGPRSRGRREGGVEFKVGWVRTEFNFELWLSEAQAAPANAPPSSPTPSPSLVHSLLSPHLSHPRLSIYPSACPLPSLNLLG